MTRGLVHASYSLPKWPGCKTDFLCNPPYCVSISTCEVSKVVVTFESEDEILKRDHLQESYTKWHICGAQVILLLNMIESTCPNSNIL